MRRYLNPDMEFFECSMDFKTIKMYRESNIVTILLNRPEIHNALNQQMISELSQVLNMLKQEHFRVLLFKGEGKSFCSGADIEYMKQLAEQNYQENVEDAKRLADLLYTLYFFPKPTIAIGKGNIFGGGIGLLACCDFSFCTKETVFSFSEARLGILPAVISPFVVRRIGISKTKELFLSAKRFNAIEAQRMGLITKLVLEKQLDVEVRNLISEILKNGPNALQNIKYLLEENIRNFDLLKLKDYTSRVLAEVRTSEEAKEGLLAFLEKRKPSWCKEIQ